MLAVQKKSAPKRKQVKRSPSELFQKKWEDIRKKKLRNEKLSDEIDQIQKKFEKEITPEQNKLTQTKKNLILHLCTFMDSKKLSLYDKGELLNSLQDIIHECINENWKEDAELLDISTKLFEYSKDLNKQEEALSDDDDDEMFGDDFEQQMAVKMFRDQLGVPEDVISDEEIIQITKDPAILESYKEKIQDYFAQEQQKKNQESNTKDKEENLEQKKLLNNTSINRLYKKLAKILHPDLEIDENKKEEKNKLMSKVVTAKNENDIITLLQIYNEYSEDNKFSFSDEEFNIFNSILRKQESDLNVEKFKLTKMSGFSSFLYSTFHSRSKKVIQSKFNDYIKYIQEECDSINQLHKQVRTVKGVRQFLHNNNSEEEELEMMSLMLHEAF